MDRDLKTDKNQNEILFKNRRMSEEKRMTRNWVRWKQINELKTEMTENERNKTKKLKRQNNWDIKNEIIKMTNQIKYQDITKTREPQA